ncbi:DUF7263 family protein [Halocatena pleomorpha]|uniref:Uncharacterized protein n=1 Tax=Halocatena pleomorpha TaxID=1785090 RepID=A0A3P3R6U2_9EURY|nr:hypothetical protein [Halocatena pleomorpha]RRJ29182.1 hypothetical protein EIK79_13680 [Halocatena pleomorpha]
MKTKTRGQASLLALVVSLVVLTAILGLALTVVDGAYRSADRDPHERRIATSLADRLVSERSPYTTRASVMNETKLRTWSGQQFTNTYPFTNKAELHVRAGNETIIERGTPTGGTTVRRIVLQERHQQQTTPISENPVIPAGIQRTTITVPARASVTTIHANDRVVLHDPSGLTGSFEIALTGLEPTQLRATEERSDAVTVTYARVQTTPTELVVTVDV